MTPSLSLLLAVLSLVVLSVGLDRASPTEPRKAPRCTDGAGPLDVAAGAAVALGMPLWLLVALLVTLAPLLVLLWLVANH